MPRRRRKKKKREKRREKDREQGKKFLYAVIGLALLFIVGVLVVRYAFAG